MSPLLNCTHTVSIKPHTYLIGCKIIWTTSGWPTQLPSLCPIFNHSYRHDNSGSSHTHNLVLKRMPYKDLARPRYIILYVICVKTLEFIIWYPCVLYPCQFPFYRYRQKCCLFLCPITNFVNQIHSLHQYKISWRKIRDERRLDLRHLRFWARFWRVLFFLLLLFIHFSLRPYYQIE